MDLPDGKNIKSAKFVSVIISHNATVKIKTPHLVYDAIY